MVNYSSGRHEFKSVETIENIIKFCFLLEFGFPYSDKIIFSTASGANMKS